MIDFHSHLDLYENRYEVLNKVVDKGCYVLAVTTTPLAWEGTNKFVGDSVRVRVAVGLHPELVLTRFREVDRLCELVHATSFVGEIGLDGTKAHRETLPLQRQIFEQTLEACESAGGKIMTIHSRGSASTVLDCLDKHNQAGTPVLHWFSGSQKELARAIELGCWFSVGPAMLKGKKGRLLASQMPHERVLTETDGPFTRDKNGPLMPWDVTKAEQVLAELWNVSLENGKKQLLENFRQLMSHKNGFA